MGKQAVKVAVCSNHFAPLVGGCEIVTGKIADFLAASGHEVFVFTRRVRSRDPILYPHLNIVEYMPGDTRTFEKKLQDVNPNSVLIYSDVFDFFRYILFRENPFKLNVALCGANWIHKTPGAARSTYRHANKVDKFICHSEFERDYKFCTTKKLLSKTVVIPNGIDLTEFDTNSLTKTDLLPGMEGSQWILSVSNFFPGKGQNHLVDILNRVEGAKDHVYIQIASDIDFSIGSRLEAEWMAKTYNYKGRSIFKKNISREQVIGFFKQSNVFAFPSEKEVAPLVLLESMAARLPWVATDVGNARGLKGGKFIAAVKNSKFYSVFDERVKILFAKAIEELIKTPVIAEEGRRQIEKEMTWNKVLPQYLSLIESQYA